MKTISRYIMTLALLLTAVTGAWAKTDPNAVSWNYQTWSGWAENVTTHTVGDITITATGSGKVYQSTSSGEPLALQAGANDAITFTSNGKPFASISIMTPGEKQVTGWTYNSSTWSLEWSGEPTTSVTLSGCNINADAITFTFGTAEAPITVEPGSSANTWTFEMPGSDVVLTPIYAKAAAFATTGSEPEAKTQLPAAAEGVIAGTDASLIAEGTGIVAFAGTSTEDKQGTLMYAIGTSATQAPDLTAFSATVPTAENVADEGADVYVWYYIQGADTPANTEATEENTFNDTEPACLTVQVLTNKFDIQFNAANANTIEAGKATVTVDGAAATVTEGKLQGVKMGTEVKVKANTGYKFRKVEVKKKAAAARPLAEATAEDLGKIAGADGNIYDTKADAETAGTTAVAMIAYVGSDTGNDTYTHGLAIALSEEDEMNWSNAKSTCEGKSAVSGAAWLLPSRNQWKTMFKANGGDDTKYTGLNTALATAGGDSSKLQKNDRYWSSSELDADFAWVLIIGEDSAGWDGAPKDLGHHVRACLAF